MPCTRTGVLAAACLMLFCCTAHSAEKAAKNEGDYMLVAAYERNATSPKEINITLSAVVERKYGSVIKGLSAEDFTISEDGKPVGSISVTPITSVSSKTDIVIILDTTGSMSNEIDGVKNSILDFTDILTKSNMDVRVGGVTFGDSVRKTFDLGSDISYRDFISEQAATAGADSPENPLDAISKALVEFSFRPEAQKIIILITDDKMHQRGDSTAGADPNSVFNSMTDAVSETAAGRYVIHTVDGSVCSDPTCPRALSKATGGSAIDLPVDGKVNLSALPIKDFILNGYSITFRSNDKQKRDHEITLRVKGAGAKYGEVTQVVYY